MDGNHRAIAQTFEACGYEVFDTHELPNFCDLILVKGKVKLFIEVKEPNGLVTEGNAKFYLKMNRAKCPVFIITSEKAAQNLALGFYEEPKLRYSKEAKKILNMP